MAGNFHIEVRNNDVVGLEIQAHAESTRKLTPAEAKGIAQAGARAMKAKMPMRSGNLKRSVKVSTAVGPLDRSSLGTFLPGREFVGRVAVLAPYAIDVDQGTGIHGPKHQVITPQNGNVFIMFKDPNAVRIERYVTTADGTRHAINYQTSSKKPRIDSATGQSMVFTRYVRGQRPARFSDAGWMAARLAASEAADRFADRAVGD